MVLKGISLKDSNTKEESSTIKKTSIKYNLLNILHGDMKHAFTKLSVSNVIIKCSQEKLAGYFTSSENKQEEKNAVTISYVEDLVRNLAFSVPFDVQIKNFRK